MVGSVPCPAMYSGLLSLLWRSWRVVGEVPWVVLVLQSWRAFSFRSLLLLSSTSQGCMPFPVCRGECSGGVRVSSPQCVVRPVSSSPGFFATVWSSPRRQIGGVPFSSSWYLLLDRSFSLLGLLRRFLRFVFRSVCLSP